MNAAMRFLVSHLEEADDTPLSVAWAIQMLGRFLLGLLSFLLSALSFWIIISLLFYDAPFPYDPTPFFP